MHGKYPLAGRVAAFSIGLLCCPVGAIAADTSSGDQATAAETWSLHSQATFVDQYHPAFKAPYSGPNSLDAGSRGNETFDATLYLGARTWSGGEVWINPEIDQGFGLSNTLGVAGYPSGEAYKVGKSTPYIRLQRLFFRQTFDLGGATETIESGANQLGGRQTADNLVITAGKISVADIFDANSYAHDPKNDFLNWSIIDAGAFDYAADAWGYSYGMASEWTRGTWTLRTGLFDLSRVPNTTELETGFSQFELVVEAQKQYDIGGNSGSVKLLGFVNRGRMGSYRDAVRLARMTGTIPDMVPVRRYTSRPGGSINLEQKMGDSLGLFARASMNDGSKEAYEFTEINRSLSLGLSLKGTDWSRTNDTMGIAGVANALSTSARAYFAAGGMGILIGDGRLPHYGTEEILEAFYSAGVSNEISVSADYQLIVDPAYNRNRGPVSVLGVRLHGQF